MSQLSVTKWIAHKCISCQACLLVCPSEALYLHEGRVSFDAGKCDSSLFCIQICFTGALEKIILDVESEE